MTRIIHGAPTVSTYQDPDGNFRAVNPRYLGFVGYGRTVDETVANLNKNIGRKPAAVREQIAALFMTLTEDEQQATLAELAKLRHS